MYPPTDLEPMKAEDQELEDLKALDFSEWFAEQKLDGARYFLHVRKGGCLLLSPHVSVKDDKPVDKSDRVPHLTKNPALAKWYAHYDGTVLDGEMTVSAEQGVSKSKLVTGILGCAPEKAIERQKERGEMVFRVFDILYLHGKDLQERPQKFRKECLELVLGTLPAGIKIVPLKQEVISNFTRLQQLYSSVLEAKGEGLILKNVKKPYIQGRRYKHTWIKLKRHASYDAVVTGYKAGEGKYKGTIGALAISQHVKGHLEDVGFISGMTDSVRAQMAKRLEYDRGCNPKDVVRCPRADWFVVEFTSQEPEEKTHRYRHGRFERIRTDKRFDECIFGAK